MHATGSATYRAKASARSPPRPSGRRADSADELLDRSGWGAPPGALSTSPMPAFALTETGLLRIVGPMDQSSSNPGTQSPDSADPEALARSVREQLADVTGGLAPDVYANAWGDWYLNLAQDPPKQWQIVEDAAAKAVVNWSFALRTA